MKKWVIIVIIVVVIFIIWNEFKKYRNLKLSQDAAKSMDKKLIIGYDKYSDTDPNLPIVFADISKKYGKDIAANVERIYRLETNHFKSDQFKKTGSAGMLSFSPFYPYGWNSLKEFWDKNPEYKPVGTNYSFSSFSYLAFPNYGGFYTLAEVLKSRGNNPGKWYSTDEDKISEYNEKIKNIKNLYV